MKSIHVDLLPVATCRSTWPTLSPYVPVHVHLSIVEHLLKPLPEAFPFIRDRGCISSVVREMRQLGLLRRQRIILRLVDALVVMDSRLAIRVENMVTTFGRRAV